MFNRKIKQYETLIKKLADDDTSGKLNLTDPCPAGQHTT